jgi:hypothetical protein
MAVLHFLQYTFIGFVFIFLHIGQCAYFLHLINHYFKHLTWNKWLQYVLKFTLSSIHITHIYSLFILHGPIYYILYRDKSIYSLIYISTDSLELWSWLPFLLLPLDLALLFYLHALIRLYNANVINKNNGTPIDIANTTNIIVIPSPDW